VTVNTLPERIEYLRSILRRVQGMQDGHSFFQPVMVTGEIARAYNEILDLAEDELFSGNELWVIWQALRQSHHPTARDLSDRVQKMHRKRIAEGWMI